MPARIESFTGPYAFLSNFAACHVAYDGRVYPSVENAYQAAKVNPAFRSKFQSCRPGEAKRMGRTLPLETPKWDAVKEPLMLELLRYKFGVRSPMASRLLSTGDAEIVEGNTWGDTYWGVYRGRGENRLGKLLMQVRDELRVAR